MIKGIYVEPLQEARVIEVEPTLDNLQELVEGLIELYYPFEDESVVCIVNEEGKINSMAPNRAIYDDNGKLIDVICGPFLIVKDGEEDFESLLEEQIQCYLDRFKTPEFIFLAENGINVVKG